MTRNLIDLMIAGGVILMGISLAGSIIIVSMLAISFILRSFCGPATQACEGEDADGRPTIPSDTSCILLGGPHQGEKVVVCWPLASLKDRMYFVERANGLYSVEWRGDLDPIEVKKDRTKLERKDVR